MPSSKPRRSPASTFSATGLRRGSAMCNSAMRFGFPLRVAARLRESGHPHRSPPEEQEQNTNIAVHVEKRSIQAAEVGRVQEGMFVNQERADDGNPHPRGPRQVEAGRQPPQKRDRQRVHRLRDAQRRSDSETPRDRMKSGLAVEVNILASVEDVETPDP